MRNIANKMPTTVKIKGKTGTIKIIKRITPTPTNNDLIMVYQYTLPTKPLLISKWGGTKTPEELERY